MQADDKQPRRSKLEDMLRHGRARLPKKAPPAQSAPSANGEVVRQVPVQPGRNAGDNLADWGVPAQRGNPDTEFKPIEQPLEQQLPEGMIELLVRDASPGPDGSPRFMLRGRWRDKDGVHESDLDEFGAPQDLNFDVLFTRDDMQPADFLRRMFDWSQRQPWLTRWLDKCRAMNPAGLELVIWDATTLQIPWELHWVEARWNQDDRQSGLLGSLLPVTRWVNVPTAWPEDLPSHYNDQPYVASGSVAAHIRPDMAHDETMLSGLRVDAAERLEDLFRDKLVTGDRLAMAYIAAHGTFGSDTEACFLDEVPLKYIEFLARDWRRLRASQALVYLNACSAGGVKIDWKGYYGGVQRGFAPVFLSARATGVIAAVSKVDDKIAHLEADQLIAYLRSEPGVRIGEAIRVLRSQAGGEDLMRAAFQLGQSNAEQTWTNRKILQLLYRFMFVYYGSPRLLVHFASGDGFVHGTGGP